MDNDIYILNPTQKEVTVRALGNYFTFKAGQVKRLNKELGDFISTKKGYMGLIDLPFELSNENMVEQEGKHVLYRDTEEGQAKYKAKCAEGVQRRVQHLQQQVNNLQVSLGQDLAKAEIKIDPLLLASKGDIEAMEELVAYQRSAEDDVKEQLEHTRKLSRALQSNSNAMANRK